MMIWPLVFLAACLSLVAAQVNYLKPGKKLSYENLRILSSNDDLPHFNQTLQSICVPRVVGTPGHETVKDFIVSELKSNGMTVELDTFVAPAPIVGQVQFTNIIGRLNPDADRFLTLACHYDSKYFPNEVFLAAIDSAVPCAMMLNAIKTMSAKLAQRPAASNSDVSLMLIFFDGEEAFAEWTDTDSLYGSRHLAKRLPDIDRIDALVLLDLIGAASPRFLSYSRQTVPLFQRFVEIERELFDGTVGYQPMFIPRFSYASIADDHLPFVAEDVPIVHLITNPFPPQWHKIEDDLDHLDPSVIANFNKILRCFTYEYLVASRRSANFRIFG